MLGGAYLLLRVSPCAVPHYPRHNQFTIPFPSHRTFSFPNPAVRQSSSHSMHSLTLVLDDSAPDVDDASGIQSRIRVFLPPEASTFTTKVQEPAKANVDESLQATKCLACVGVAVVIYPTAHRLIHLLNKLHRRNCRPPLGEVLNPPSDIALCHLTGKDVDARLATLGRATLHELEPDEVKPFGQLRNPGLFAIDRQSHSRGNRGKCLKRLFGALAAYQDRVIGIAVQRSSQFLRVTALMPHLIQQVEIDIAVQRRNRRPLRDAYRRRLHLSLIRYLYR